MRIDVIDDYETLIALKANWEAVYECDPESQFFLSWTWLTRWLETDDSQWFILAAAPDAQGSDYVAFFPLRLKTKKKKSGGFYNEISFAGKGLSDYAGLICTVEHETAAISAFANHLKRSNWARLNFNCLRASDNRRQLLFAPFVGKNFKRTEYRAINKTDNVDNNICPYVTLPNDWDSYLETVSTNTRQKIRRFLRKIENSDEFHITLSDADTIESNVDVLLGFWRTQWGPRKGDRLQTILKTNRTMLNRSFEEGALFLPVIWQGDRPLAATASFIDRTKGALLFFIGGRDETFRGPPPTGFLLHAWSIRHAIDQGFKMYDFLRGNEPYKYVFGSQESYIKHLVVETINQQNLRKKLDIRSLPEVLKRSHALHKAGRHGEAEIAYHQILKVEPESAGALYGLGQLLAQKGNHSAAVRSFKLLTSVRPNSEKAWLRLGRSLEARERFADAVEAYRNVIRCKPEHSPAYRKLGRTLEKLGRLDEAAAAFEAAARMPAEQEFMRAQ